jgi:hypothetical protein
MTQKGGMMASKERPNLTSIETARPARLEEARQRERQQQLARQLAVNAEVRKRWAEADQVEAFQSQRANDYATLPPALSGNLSAAIT